MVLQNGDDELNQGVQAITLQEACSYQLGVLSYSKVSNVWEESPSRLLGRGKHMWIFGYFNQEQENSLSLSATSRVDIREKEREMNKTTWAGKKKKSGVGVAGGEKERKAPRGEIRKTDIKQLWVVRPLDISAPWHLREKSSSSFSFVSLVKLAIC